MLTTFARIAKILKGLVEPRNWIEDAFADVSGGGDGGTLFLHEDENGTLDKTWQEIYDALQNKAVVIPWTGRSATGQYYVFEATHNPGSGYAYLVSAKNMQENVTLVYQTTSANEQPGLRL